MYTIPLKDNSKEIDLVVLRSLLALAGITAFFFRTGHNVFINIIISVTLLAAAFVVNYLFAVARINKNLLLIAAALLLVVATHAITFSLLMVATGMLSSFIYKKPFVLLSEKTVTVKSSKGRTDYEWEEFDNIVFKDNLLTLDYKSNKLLQLEVDISGNALNENEINEFCRSCLAT